MTPLPARRHPPRMTDEEIDALREAAALARKKRSSFAFCPRGPDNKPQLLIMWRMPRKRIQQMRSGARVKTIVTGSIEVDDKNKLVFVTEHPQAATLTKALRSALPALVPVLRGAWVVHPDGEEVGDDEAPEPGDGVTEDDARRAASLRAALSEEGESTEYEDDASFVLSPRGTITVVAMERPSFRRSTSRELSRRYPDFHDEDGKLLPGNDRRHELAWEMLELEMAHELLGRDLSGAAAHLRGEGYPPDSENIEDISAATWEMAKDRFNDLDNLWVGPSTPNRNLGRLIPVLKRLLLEVQAGLDLEEHPVTRSLRSFDIPEMSQLILDDPELLRDWFFQALLDPELVDRDETAELLTRAEAIFQRLFPPTR